MRTGLVTLIVAIVLGGLVGTLMVRDPGYLLVVYDRQAVETSLWFAAILLIGLYFVVRLLVFVTARLIQGKGSLSEWNRQRRAQGARVQTVQGLLLMAEGEWAEAKRLLLNAAARANTPLINYLNAARAAHELGLTEERDDLLRQAHETTPGSRFAVGLTQAQLQMAKAQWEQCLATLLQLRQESPKHPLVLRMLSTCYEELGDWPSLIKIAPDLKKIKLVDVDSLNAMQTLAWSKRLAEVDNIEALWKSVPKDLKRDPVLIEACVKRMLELEAPNAAEGVLRDGLNRGWNEVLVGLYGQVVTDSPEYQLVVAEGWLKQRPNDASLLLALGRISMMNSEWPKAREYLEASLRLQRSQEVYGELGRLCTALGETERGGEYLSRAYVNLPELPLPTSAPRAVGENV
ncbi:MAG: heme biosynthesis protein HemY [Gammaproteobacteria bacterium]|nr:heme biosynthesis protein HemY [Gammaproteobacteria bacterium]